MMTHKQALYLLHQRTDYLSALDALYKQDMAHMFMTLDNHLPRQAETIMDVGCGLGGINIRMRQRYPGARLYLVDKMEAPGRKTDYHLSPNDFAGYNDMRETTDYLASNGVRGDIATILDGGTLPDVDLAYSFLSMGFHYPLTTYKFRAKVLIVDIRRGTNQTLPENAEIIDRGKKHDRYKIADYNCS